jgi:hypothetical protein
MCNPFGSSGGSGGLAPIQQSTTQASPQAIGAYTKALGLADVAAAQPFQKYSTDPNAFVAPLTGTQQQAIGGLYGAQGAYQPYYQAAGALTGAAGTTLTPQVVGQYMNPFMQQVVNPVQQALQQQQGQQLSQQQAEAIKGGAFGGERAGLQRQALRGQQQLGMGQALSPLYQQGYGQALQAAQGDLARQLQAGQAFGALGTGAQTAALQAPQALLGAGTLEQQTQQAGLSALYNQFLQERAYPYQQAQFYANVAGGLGPLLGQTTYQSQAQNPFGSFLSEPSAKMGVDGRPQAAMGGEQDRSQPDVVGRTFDDQNIYAYRYKDGSPAQLGLMADEVQRAHPEAVGYAPTGDRMVDYAAATDAAARMGGAVKDTGDYARGGYAIGGHLSYVDPSDPGASDRRRMEALLASHKGGLSGAASEYGPSGQSYVTQKTYVPAGTVRAGQQLQHASFSAPQQRSGLGDAIATGEKLGSLLSKGYAAYNKYKESKLSGGGGNETEMAVGGIVPTSYIPEEVTGEVRTSQGLRPAEFAAKEREESGLSKLMGVGEKALDIGMKYGPLLAKGAGMLAAFSEPSMKTGVRPAARDGMGIRPSNDDDIFDRGIIGAESRGRQFDREGRPLTSSAGAIGIAQVMPGTAPEAARLAGLEFDPVRYRTDADYNKALGKAYFNKQLETFGSEDKAAAAYNAGPGALQKALRRAEREGGDYLSYLPAETRAYVPKVMGLAGARGEDEGITRVTPEAVSRARSGLGLDRMAGNFSPEQRRMMAFDESSKSGVGAAKEEGGLGDYLTSEEFLIPALTGLGTAATTMLGAPTTNIGSAIGMGLGAGTVAGAQQVLPTKAKQAEIERAKQEAGKIGEESRQVQAETLKSVLESGRFGIQQFGPADAPFYIVTLEDGTKMPLEQWMEKGGNLIGGTVAADIARRLAGGSGISATPPVETAKEVFKEPAVEPSLTKQPPLTQPVKAPTLTPGVIYDDESRKLAQEDRKLKFSTDPSLVRTAEEARKIYAPQTILDAQTARNNTPYLNELASSLAEANKGKGFATPGYAAATRAQLIKAADTLYRALGGEGTLSNLPKVADVTGKITNLLGRESAASAGQESYAALNAIREAIPNIEMDPRAGAKLAAELMVLRKRSIDREEHMKAWSRDSGGILYNTQNNFSEKNPDAKYQIAQQVIADMIVHHPDALEKIMSGTLSRESIERQIRSPREKGGYGAGVPVGISEFFPSTETTRRKTP